MKFWDAMRLSTLNPKPGTIEVMEFGKVLQGVHLPGGYLEAHGA